MECNSQSCGGCRQTDCGGCPSQNGTLFLTQEELEALLRFSQLPFLPVARRAGGESPLLLDEPRDPSLDAALEGLRQKGLVQVDEDLPLSNFNYAPFGDFAHRGSAALTQTGQTALELLEIQGAEE